MPDNPLWGHPHFMLLHCWPADIRVSGVSSLPGFYCPAVGSTAPVPWCRTTTPLIPTAPIDAPLANPLLTSTFVAPPCLLS